MTRPAKIDKQALIEMHAIGAGNSALARAFDVTPAAVSFRLKSLGLVPNIDMRTLPKPRSPRRNVARQLKQAGLTYAEIGERMGISRQRAQQLVRPTTKELAEFVESRGNACEECYATGVKLDTHHDNYIGAPTRLLCTPCHKKADAQMGLQSGRPRRASSATPTGVQA